MGLKKPVLAYETIAAEREALSKRFGAEIFDMANRRKPVVAARKAAIAWLRANRGKIGGLKVTKVRLVPADTDGADPLTWPDVGAIMGFASTAGAWLSAER